MAQVETKYNSSISLDENFIVKSQPKIKVEKLQDILIYLRLKKDQGGLMDKSPIKLVKLAYKLIQLIIKTNNNKCKPNI